MTCKQMTTRLLNLSGNTKTIERIRDSQKTCQNHHLILESIVDEIRKKEMLHQTERVVLSSIPSLHQSISSQEAYVIPQPDQYRTSIPHFFPFPFQVQNIPFAFRMPIPVLALEVLTPLSSAAILPHPGTLSIHASLSSVVYI